ncbi:MAG: site-specific DNA-methyltransferase [Ignavibacteria bacterium]|nr:site-specific DNA-methyltransferase [Ignavibacteria bacterium]
MKTWHKIVIGDSRWMKEVEDESVHLIVTSPPYWQLKDYGNGKQIGFNDTYEDYINNLNLVWKECHRVLHKGCRLCINIGDQFARSVYYGRYKVIPIRTEIIKFCETIGFDYMGAIIWQKVTTCNTTGGATIMGSYPYPRNGIIKLDYEFILVFKKYGNPPKVDKEIKEKSKLSLEEWNQYFSGHWNFPGEKQEKHLAMFPEELPKRLIKMYSFLGETVLDPFLGSGTTTLAAKNLGRNSIGYEINEDFLNIILEKVNPQMDIFFEYDKIEIIKQPPPEIDFKSEMLKLPYLFRDPIKFDKKVDPRELNFGSKVHMNENNKNATLRVVDVLEPNLLLLSNGLKARLLGVKIRNDRYNEAINFLKEKVLKKKVILKFDKEKYDKDNNLLCYLFLQNKTFINAHLIKNKLVDVDYDCDYLLRNQFSKILLVSK